MAGERRARILARLVESVSGEFETTRLCAVCRDITGMTGAGIMLMSDEVPRWSLCTTDQHADALVIADVELAAGADFHLVVQQAARHGRRTARHPGGARSCDYGPMSPPDPPQSEP